MKNKYFDRWEFKQANSIIETNPLEAKLKFEQYLEKYPEDYSTYYYYASVLIILGDLDVAEKVLNFVEEKANNNKEFTNDLKKVNILNYGILFNRLRILSYKGDYEEFYRIYTQNINLTANMDINHCLFYCKQKLGKLDNEIREQNPYLFRQIIEYKESDFLKHIKKHLYDHKIQMPNESFFFADFPIDKIIEEIKLYIPSSKKLCFGFFQDVYAFKYNNCGTDINKLADYFKVICLHNTANFITIFPSSKCQNFPYIDLNYLACDNKNKVKKLSQTEKFNMRYKKN